MPLALSPTTINRYQGIANTIVQLFVSRASGVMTFRSPTHSECSETGTEQSRKNMKILMVLTSHDTLGSTGRKTGFWLEEFAAPYFVFRDAGEDTT